MVFRGVKSFLAILKDPNASGCFVGIAPYPTMKTSFTRSCLTLIALSFAARIDAAAESETVSRSAGEIILHTVTAPNRVNGDAVNPGTSRIMVSMRLGRPTAVLADGTWLYQGYRARMTRRDADHTDADANPEFVGTGTLIVRFVSQKVASLSIADEPTIAALRQKTQDAGNRQIAAASGGR